MKKQNEMKLPECYVDMEAQEAVSTGGKGPKNRRLIGDSFSESSSSIGIFDNSGLIDNASFADEDIQKLMADLNPGVNNSVVDTKPKTASSSMDKLMGVSMLIQSGGGLAAGIAQYIKSCKKN